MAEYRDWSLWRRARLWLPVLGIVLALAAGLVARGVSSSRARHSIQAIRARNLPVTARELDAWYTRVQATNNAAQLYLEAFLEHVAPPKGNDPDESKEQMKAGEPLPA